MNAFCLSAERQTTGREERLRDEPRRGAVVVVRVGHVLRVELGLVVEVEVRGVAERAITVIGKYAHIHP